MTHLLERLARYIRTVRWLRVSQVAWFVIRRLLPAVQPKTIAVEAQRASLVHVALPRIIQPETCTFSFLSIDEHAAVPVDWHPEDKPRLWRYNLHYFDFLHWYAFSDELKAKLIDDWIEQNPMGTEDAWEPYTVSLRIVNWAKFFSLLESEVPERWHCSLINQANWLSHNLEYHILANHFLKNAKALVFAGALYAGSNGARFLERGTELFLQETIEQVLSDGGHYERSLMYHSIVVEDLLDVVNLGNAQPQQFSAEFVARVSAAADSAVRFLEDMLGGDGSIPLFNDAAFGIAPLPAELVAYAQRVTGYDPAPRPDVPLRIEKGASGYYGYRVGNETLLIDCGALAPDYQPGHGHCDCLSFELCLDGARVVVDTGTYGYEVGERRRYLRGTSAHNTVEVAGEEQSEIWGGFRVARRARPLAVGVQEFSRTDMVFAGAHDGYTRLKQQVVHRREVTAKFGQSWVVADQLTGQGTATARSFVHFAPGLELREAEPECWEVRRGEQAVLRLRLQPGCSAHVAATEYYPQFGVVQQQETLVMELTGKLPFQTGYSLEKISQNH